MDRLKVLSVFKTVDGECNRWGPGNWTVFVRFAGCSIHCKWCDTAYSWAFQQGKEYTVDELVQQIQNLSKGTLKVTLTGGEPLEQNEEDLDSLLHELIYLFGYKVSIETGGCHPLTKFREGYPEGLLNFVVDYKLPSSMATLSPSEAAFSCLALGDYVKVVCNADDLRDGSLSMALDVLKVWNCLAEIRLSPEHGKLHPKDLYVWLKEKPELCARRIGINLQMHKYIFPDDFREEEDGSMDVDFTRRSAKTR